MKQCWWCLLVFTTLRVGCIGERKKNFNTAQCGDGVILDESCDDGNTDNGDGCTSDCRVEVDFVCTGEPSVCSPSQGDPVCGNSIIEAGEDCDDGSNAGDDGCSACAVEEGWQCSGAGPSVCRLIPVCGNGSVEEGEGCDDGNVGGSDGCNSDCEVEPDWTCGGSPSICSRDTECGDAVIEEPETCDDGNTTPGDGCDAGCQEEPGFACEGTPSTCSTTCGDGIAAGDEPCDGGESGSETCNNDCTPSVCGDGKVNLGALEQCDTGGKPTEFCDVDCTGVLCGDGLANAAAGETCDDGNQVSGDGCDRNCLVEGGPEGCADGTVEEEFSSNMVGCGGTVTFPGRATLCAAGYRVCSSASYLRYVGSATPQYHYWTNDRLNFGGTQFACFATMPPSGSTCSSPDTPMRVCAKASDPLGNTCNWFGCGWDSETPNRFFGGCNNNLTAGALCCLIL